MEYENSNTNSQVVKPEYRQSISGILHVSMETMRHLTTTNEGRENLISARAVALLSGNNLNTYILNENNPKPKGLEVELESISGKGVYIRVSHKINALEASKAGIFFILSTCVANLMSFYAKDSEMALHSITSDCKRINSAYIKSSYLSSQASAPTPKPSYKPAPIPYKYVEDKVSSKDNIWRDSLDDWQNPYAKPTDTAPAPNKNPYLDYIDDDLDDWQNPYKNEPILESTNTTSYATNTADKKYPQDDGIGANSIKINFLDPLAETLGVSELNLSTTTLNEYTIRGLKQALIEKYPQWQNYFLSSNLMFSVNRQVSMSEYDEVSGGALVTIFLTG